MYRIIATFAFSALIADARPLTSRDSAFCPKVWDGKPKPEDVSQGNTADCWMLSVVAAMAKVDNDGLMNVFGKMACDSDQPSIPVTLYGDPGQQAKFDVKFTGDAQTFTIDGIREDNSFYALEETQNAADALWWPGIMTNAFIQLQPSESDEINHNLEYGMPDVALEKLYGKSATCHDLGEVDLAQTLKHAADTPMVIATTSSPTNGWATSHAYSVFESDGTTAVVRNPWGHTIPDGAEDQGDGVFKVQIEGDASAINGGSVKQICYLDDGLSSEPKSSTPESSSSVSSASGPSKSISSSSKSSSTQHSRPTQAPDHGRPDAGPPGDDYMNNNIKIVTKYVTVDA